MKKLFNWVIGVLKLKNTKKDSTKDILENIVDELKSDETKIKRLTYTKRTDI